MNLKYTKHANVRCQQRGIPKEAIEFIYKHGSTINTHEAKKYFCNNRWLDNCTFNSLCVFSSYFTLYNYVKMIKPEWHFMERDKRLIRIYSDIQGRLSILREDLTVVDNTLKKLLANKPIYLQDINTVRDLLGDDLSERLQSLVVSDDYPPNPNRI